jgi:hypothetical protein
MEELRNLERGKAGDYGSEESEMNYTMIDKTGEGHYYTLRDAISNAHYEGPWKVINDEGHVVACSQVPNQMYGYCLEVCDTVDEGDPGTWAGFFASLDDAVNHGKALQADWNDWWVTNVMTGRIVRKK